MFEWKNCIHCLTVIKLILDIIIECKTGFIHLDIKIKNGPLLNVRSVFRDILVTFLQQACCNLFGSQSVREVLTIIVPFERSWKHKSSVSILTTPFRNFEKKNSFRSTKN